MGTRILSWAIPRSNLWALGGYTIFLSVFALLGVAGALGPSSFVRE